MKSPDIVMEAITRPDDAPRSPGLLAIADLNRASFDFADADCGA